MSRLKRPVEEVRAELLADPNTHQIAEKLGMGVPEYVELVLEYAQNPDKQPEFNLISEGEAKAAGVATTGEVRQWFDDVAEGRIDLRPAHLRDGFEASTGRGKPVEIDEDTITGARKKP